MKTIIDLLRTNDNIALFTHVMPDGDALGSLFGLAHVLKNADKKVDVYVSGQVPKRLQFMAEDYADSYYIAPQDKKYDLCIAVDCGDEKRLGVYQEMFFAAKDTLNIDHHISNIGFARYNLVRQQASSTGEILFELLKQMCVCWDAITASLIYGSIASDTGCFRFSNTTASTHIYAAELMQNGANFVKYNKKLFDTHTKTALKAQAYVIENIQYYYDGKVAAASISDQTLQEMGASKEDTEGLIDVLKKIEGVEVALLLKQQDAETKLSVRTSEYVDACAFTALFGGGGHIRAAGCTISLPIEQAKEKVIKALEEFI